MKMISVAKRFLSKSNRHFDVMMNLRLFAVAVLILGFVCFVHSYSRERYSNERHSGEDSSEERYYGGHHRGYGE